MITQSRLKELFTLDADRGELVWRKTGKTAGCRRHDGYVIVGVDKRLYLRHRLVWMYVYGELPPSIDHVNCKKGDDRIGNLRAASHQLNIANTRRPSANKSGFKGVHWHPQSKKWRVQIGCRENREHIGLFSTVNEASSAYADAAIRKYGEFARTE